ncbi:hypothetical protein CBM2589_B120286 [Cupriavidus taiwanensis]|uniref:Uncharacterized protein n=1 Tax=Cupriavidus taiwanensis TaxID=164546 RepID=A0A375BH00_9BURK|nr:hypothetical protein CBM2589_B120286 [Cupriavidus taiwanensis]
MLPARLSDALTGFRQPLIAF